MDDLDPNDLAPSLATAVCRHLDALNWRFLALSSHLDHVESTIAEIIGEKHEPETKCRLKFISDEATSKARS